MNQLIIAERPIAAEGSIESCTSVQDTACPADCPFLDLNGVEIISSELIGQAAPGIFSQFFTRITGIVLEPDQGLNMGFETCRLVARLGGDSSVNELQEVVEGLKPDAPLPQDLECPAGVSVSRNNGHMEVAVSELKMDPIPLKEV